MNKIIKEIYKVTRYCRVMSLQFSFLKYNYMAASN